MKRISPGLPSLVLAALATLVSGGCSGESSAFAAETDTGSKLIDPQAQQLLQGLGQARYGMRLTGRREVRWVQRGENEDVTYRFLEDVQSDGGGVVKVTAISLLEPALPAQDQELFLLMQRARSGFSFHYRDFGLEDMDAFSRSYRVSLGGTTTVAGLTCQQLDIDNLFPGGVHYRVQVDLTSGMALEVEESDAYGLLARYTFQTVTIMPGGTAPPTILPKGLEELALDQLETEMGFAPLVPTDVPFGYELTHAYRAPAPGEGPRLVLRFDDGLESLFLVQSAPTGARPMPQGNTPLEVRHISIGPWQVLVTWRGDQELFVVGKPSIAELGWLVNSL